ncbi:beta-glucan synthesis-associated protein-domain-containing protein [Mycena haematopus]|nr:beta-glucan synthesis-associated protein-domain-containing protein [Mycena haematopus]
MASPLDRHASPSSSLLPLPLPPLLIHTLFPGRLASFFSRHALPQQPSHSYQPNRAGASIATDPFASPRNSFGSTHSHGSQSSVGSSVSAYTSYAQGPRPAPSILSEHGDGRYAEQSRGKRRQPAALRAQYNIGVDPVGWTTKPEADDFLHDPRLDKKKRGRFGRRALVNIGCLVVLVLLIVGGSVAYPIARHFMANNKDDPAASGSSALDANANLPNISSWALIDAATPQDAHTIYWEAVNLHYWQTGDLEWYDPSAVTTKNGALEITLSKVTISQTITTSRPAVRLSFLPPSHTLHIYHDSMYRRHDLLMEQILLHRRHPPQQRHPPRNLDSMWPYSYDTCDVSTLPDNSGPQAALDTGGIRMRSSAFLPGQRLSASLTAGNWFFQGESHPGPTTASGTFVGRSAPEIDVFEATIGGPTGASVGQVSQSAQWAPFDAGYASFNMTDNLVIPDPTISAQNAFVGNQFQQTTSVDREQECYQLKSGCFSTYGFEYTPGDSDVYISWITDDNLAWTLNCNTVGADKATQIGARLLESLTHTHS